MLIEEVRADPRQGAGDVAAAASASQASSASRRAWVVAAAGLGAAGLFAALWLGARQGDAPERVLQAALVAPEHMGFGDTFELSPDGSRIVFEAYDEKTGARALWLRTLDRGDATRLAPTEGGEMPFWSPDGTQLGFFADGKLKRFDPRGGSAQVICDAPTPRGGTWGPDGRIVFAAAFRTGLSIVPAAGGVPTSLTALDAARHEKSHGFPVFLPGGKQILFLAQTAEGGAVDDESAIEALDLASGKRTLLIRVNSSPLFASSTSGSRAGQNMVGKATFDHLIAAGKARFEGDRKPFDQFRGILVQFTPDFEMMPGTKPATQTVPATKDPFEGRTSLQIRQGDRQPRSREATLDKKIAFGDLKIVGWGRLADDQASFSHDTTIFSGLRTVIRF